MPKIVKLNFTKKVRYIFDKETEENLQLCEKVTDHFGSFINNSWEMSDVKRLSQSTPRVRTVSRGVPREEMDTTEEEGPPRSG